MSALTSRTKRLNLPGILVAAVGIAALGLSPGRVAGEASPKKLNNDQKILQVLNRLEFGPRPGDMESVRKMGITRWIDQQLSPETLDDSVVEKKLAALPTLRMSLEEMMTNYTDEQMQNRNRQLAVQAARQAPPGAMKEGEGGNFPALPPAPMQPNPALRMQQMGMMQGRNSIEALGELNNSKLLRACESNRQLQEVLVDFWSNHFNLDVKKGLVRALKPADERDVIRPHVLGKFHDLLEASAKSPAMLFYLDNASSTRDFNDPNSGPPLGRPGVGAPGRPFANPNGAGPGRPLANPNGVGPNGGNPQAGNMPRPNRQPGVGPQGSGMPGNGQPGAGQPRPAQQRRPGGGLNENYARELMELHTLGVDGGYTQKDVQEVARCFTGWTIDRSNGAFIFRPFLHDNGEKIVLGHRIPAGGGIQDGETVLDIVASHPATAQHLARQLCQRLIADDPPKSVVDRAAQTFQKTGGDLRAVVRTIVTSPEFLSPTAYHAKMKSPFEYAVSAVRALNGTFEAPDPAVPQVRLRLISDGATSMGRGNGGRPGGFARQSLAQEIALMGQPMFSHEAPTGYPEDSREWVSSGALLARFNFAEDLASQRVAAVTFGPPTLPQNVSVGDHKAYLKALSHVILGGDLSEGAKTAILEQMDAGAGPAKVLALILGSPDFQRR